MMRGTGPGLLIPAVEREEVADASEEVALVIPHALPRRLLAESLADGVQLGAAAREHVGDVFGDFGAAAQDVFEGLLVEAVALHVGSGEDGRRARRARHQDRKSTRLNSS